VSGDVAPAVHIATSFARDEHGVLPAGLPYSRYGNPTVLQAEALLAKLDGAKEARLFGSGLAAAAAVIGTLRRGDRIVAPRIMYHGAQDLIRKVARDHGAETTLFDQADPKSLEAALRSTSMIWIESPANPTWDVIDVAAAAKAAPLRRRLPVHGRIGRPGSYDPRSRAWRRHRLSIRHQISERTQRCLGGMFGHECDQ
jgi:cystathionine gamma-synthase